ncbi:MAG: ribonuclease HII [Thermoprotei archaeon]|nr:MAG: ribonuclease HII [Thermoprotei archaeon]
MDKGICSIEIGIDEAGRGPLLGDLVVGVVANDSRNSQWLISANIRDSKELSQKQRENLAKYILEHADLVVTAYVPPRLIDRYKLNKLVADTIVEILEVVIEVLEKPKHRIRVYVDEVKGYSKYIEEKLRKNRRSDVEFVMEKKADKKYPIVSAASIIAKYVRDSNLYASRIIYGDFGSGYPSDTVTRNWISSYSKLYREPPPIVRRSWSTLLNLAPHWYFNPKKGRNILEYLMG